MSQPDAETALNRLLEGNARHVAGKDTHPHQTAVYWHTLVKEQHPFAVILGCADSRVPPELLFDQGFGDLFVIRVAGNVVDDMILASVEYAVAVLHVPLVMVLGHSGCGAVGAVVYHHKLTSHLPELAGVIQPAVDAAQGQGDERLENAVKINAQRSVEQLSSGSQIVTGAIALGDLRVVAAYYDLETGVVMVVD